MRHRLPLLAATLALAALGGCGDSTAPRAPIDLGPGITVDPGQDRGPVNRLVFGHNIEAGNAKDIFSAKTDTLELRAGCGAWDVARKAPHPDTLAWSKAIGMGMLRYPGGCLTHNFDWKQAVGPLSERPLFTFGIDEYLTFCRAVGCEPLMNVSEIASPADAAALVEYLNAPADAAHPWALKRAAWGHPQPWGVRWFEMANESDHGNHQVTPHLQRTAAEYARWVLEAGAAMRAVDPAIRIGAHVGTGTPVTDPWNRTLLETVKTRIDFVAIHTYAVGAPPASASPDQVGRACMAAAAQTGAELADYRALVRACTGADIPLAVTEYNAGFSGPEPWRFSFAAALHSADQLRLMLEPEANVAMAQYWQFLNGYWGFLRGPEVPATDVRWTTTAAAPLFRLWGGHAGTRLVASRVDGVAKLEFEGFKRVAPARGEARIAPALAGSAPLVFTTAVHGPVAITAGSAGSATVAVQAITGERYLNLPTAIPVQGGHIYRLRWEQQVEGRAHGFSPGLGLCDARGWQATQSACGSSNAVPGPDGWAEVEAEMSALPDATAVVGVVRLIGDRTPSTAVIRIRNARVEHLTPRIEPAFDPVTTHASLAADGRTLHLVVFNKHHDQDLTLRVRVADRSATGARAWCVTGPFQATNLERGQDAAVREVLGGRAVEGVAPDGFTCTFPARSMTAIDIAR